MDETAEWCNSFVLVPKSNGKVRLCLDPASLNQALIRPMHRGPTLNDILPKPNNAQYLSLIMSSSYHNLKLDEKSLYLISFACQFSRYRYKRLPFGEAPAGNMFQREIDKIFQDLPKVFCIVDDILVIEYEADGKDHDETLQRVLQVCREVDLKLNRDKCHFRCTSVPFFGEIISRYGVKPDPRKLKALMEMPPPKTKKELQAFLGIINYLSKFPPSTANICDSLKQLTLSKTEWTWNATYQKLFDKAKSILKEDGCMKFYDETQPLYLETDASGVRLGGVLLHTRSGTSCPGDKAPDNSILRPIDFASKSIKCVKKIQ